jgi:NADH-quinone oxidoreductase subunit M
MDNILAAIHGHLISIITFLPLLGIVVLFFINREKINLIRGIGVGFTAVCLLLSLWMLAEYSNNTAAMQFQEGPYAWIPFINANFHMGVDGLSFPLFILTTLLSFLAAIASFSVKQKVKDYYILYLLLMTGMLGVFVSLDLVLFYVFWEVVLVPMYFLIGIWGGERREYAAIKFFLYTLLGSVVMLLGILALYFYPKPGGGIMGSFSIPELIAAAQAGTFDLTFQILIFLAFFLGFAIKVPIFPFHTWLPDAHVEAPTAISVLLAGVLLKMGGYGFIRISYGIAPGAGAWEYFRWGMAALGLINIVYGALVAMAQKDFKKLIAYSSVSHMGFVLLGIAAANPEGYTGAVLQMFNHGIITGALFLLVGVLYDRAHTREINAFGGLAKKLPIYSGIVWFTFLASLGLPGLSGFVSEFLCFIGSFKVYTWMVAISTFGIIVTASYFLWTIQRMFLGPFNTKWEGLTDINGRELVTLIPLMALALLLGVYPSLLIDMMTPTMNYLVSLTHVVF